MALYLAELHVRYTTFRVRSVSPDNPLIPQRDRVDLPGLEPGAFRMPSG